MFVQLVKSNKVSWTNKCLLFGHRLHIGMASQIVMLRWYRWWWQEGVHLSRHYRVC